MRHSIDIRQLRKDQFKDQVKDQFEVRIIEGRGESIHRVSVTDDDYRRLTGGRITPEELIRRSFEFLLERESKESILPEFELKVIGRYFPDYERELKRRI